jgi:hypothetical protein
MILTRHIPGQDLVAIYSNEEAHDIVDAIIQTSVCEEESKYDHAEVPIPISATNWGEFSCVYEF